MHIGIAGTGKMGSAIAARLLGLGHQVTVFNRSRERAEPLLALGAAWADSAAKLAQATDIIVSLLTNEQALDDVYLSEHGLLSGDVAGKLFIEMSTVSPAKHQALALQVQAVQAAYLECPVSGSVGPAKEGKLIGFVGGEAQDLERARPYLESVCRLVEHVGPYGSGATMKLAVNLPLMVYWQTFGEALSLIAPLGLDPERVVTIFGVLRRPQYAEGAWSDGGQSLGGRARLWGHGERGHHAKRCSFHAGSGASASPFDALDYSHLEKL